MSAAGLPANWVTDQMIAETLKEYQSMEGAALALRWEFEKARTSSKGERVCNRACPVTLTRSVDEGKGTLGSPAITARSQVHNKVLGSSLSRRRG